MPAGLFAVAAIFIAALWWWLGAPVAMPALEIGRSHKLECVSYAPFREGQNPLGSGTRIERWQIEDDMAHLAGVTHCIRTYAIEHGLDQVAEIAGRHGLRVIQGLWLSSNAAKNQLEIDTVVKLANLYPETIRSIVVGNEVLLRGEISAADLANIIRGVKARTKVPVTYADVWEFWLRHRELVDVVDFVTIHILPYWEDIPISARDAVAHIDSIRRHMVAALPGKEILLGETGYPSQGRMRDVALPSPSNQARVLHEVIELARRDRFRVNLIEAFDQPWKRYLEGTVGGYWGLFDAYTRGQKFEWGKPVSDHPLWRWQALLGVGFAALVFGVASFAERRSRKPAAPSQWAGVCLCAIAGGSMIGLAAERMPIESLGAGGWMRSAAFFAVAAAAPLLASVALIRDMPAPGFSAVLARRDARLRDPFLLALGVTLIATTVLVIQTALGLVFDPRYKDFPYAPMSAAIIPFLVLSLLVTRPRGARQAAEIAASGLLTLSAIYVLPNEGIANWQSVWFCALLAALALTLYRARGAPG
ncbi:MAG: beta-(1-6) glucans synthase [Pseudorhodoplanes sp.]|nr:beta-(1-6) glucans synthase [Pseudorhodoplanes sp.]